MAGCCIVGVLFAITTTVAPTPWVVLLLRLWLCIVIVVMYV